MGHEPWGHSVQKLAMEYPRPEELTERDRWIQAGAFLDRLYIPTRYQNGLPDLTHEQVYLQVDAEQALELAGWLVEAARRIVEGGKVTP